VADVELHTTKGVDPLGMFDPTFRRHKTREVKVGDKIFGGDHPIWVQSMTTTETSNVDATVAQIRALADAGCELVRVTVPKKEDLEAIPLIRKQSPIPVICDIHFDFRMALGCIDHGVDKIRINPGNIGGEERFKQVVVRARDKGIPMRIGVNGGSLEKDLLEKHGYPSPAALVESALRHIETAESLGYHQIIVSLKSSDTRTVSESYRLYAEQANYPTHIGLTEAGKPPYAIIKSACGLAPILLAGIGDTIRISLLGDPVPEIQAAFDILQATGRRVRKPELIACPTCGRLEIDLEGIIEKVQGELNQRKLPPMTISILGCIVNGIGEGKTADLGIAAGQGKGVIFRRGELVKRVTEAEMVPALLEEAERLADDIREGRAASSHFGANSSNSPLPILQ
jgi:(E)-4-hydroxy-3-methylbut-2-enyl-diphosphate synthase